MADKSDKTERITLRLSPEEKARWEQLANGRPLGAWIRARVADGIARPEVVNGDDLPVMAARELTTDEIRQFKPDFKGRR